MTRRKKKGGEDVGSTFGALIEPFIGWRALFLGVSLLDTMVLSLLLPYQRLWGDATPARSGTLRDVFAAHGLLLGPRRGRRTYVYGLLNAVFHSGVFTWLCLCFARRYGLGEVGTSGEHSLDA